LLSLSRSRLSLSTQVSSSKHLSGQAFAPVPTPPPSFLMWRMSYASLHAET
jgi:hypothetical protein